MISHAYVSVELAQAKARELARRPGLDVTVVAPSRFFELGRWMPAERPAAPEYRLEVLPVALPMVRGQRHAYFYPRGLVKLMRSLRPDVVNLWEEPYSAVSTQVALARRAVARRAALVLNPSQQAVKRQPPPFRWGESYVVRSASYVVGRSPESVAVVEAKGYRGPSAVIGHGIELGVLGPRDRAASRRELGIPEDGRVVSFAGRLVPDKGIDVLLDAIARMPGRVGALIVGEGPEEAALRAQADRLGLADRVWFHGPLPMERVAAAFTAGDVVAMPSRHEPWGRVAIEAMACGVPLVAGAAGHLPALVGEHGRLVRPGDADDLARALGEALDEPEPARGGAGRARPRLRGHLLVGGPGRALGGRLPRGRGGQRGAPVIRCAFVSHHTGYGGAELMLLTLLERLDRARVTPILLTPGEGMLTEGARARGAEVAGRAGLPVAAGRLARRARARASTRCGPRRPCPSPRPRLARAISAARADVVVTNSAKAHVYGSLAGRLARRPVVWRMHDTMDSADFAGSTRRLLLAIGRRVPVLVLTVSDSTGRALVEGGVPAGARGDALQRHRPRRPRAKAPPGRPPGSTAPPASGRWAASPRSRATRSCSTRRPTCWSGGSNARFVIAGAPAREAPGHLQELHARAERLGIAERVELISPFADLAEVLAGLDVMVHASVLPDSLPTTVLEAMALGVPVVATDLGGVPEMVRDAETGVVVPPNDPGRIADAVADLIAAPETRAAVGRAAFEEASARFDVASFADAFATHLEHVVRRPRT